MRKMLNKKKIIALVLIAAMVLASAATVFADTVVTTTIATPLYKYATVADGEYGTVPQGTSLTVISNTGVFYYVIYGGNYGYILQSACGGGSAIGTGTNVSYYVTTNTITNLYYSANTSGGSYGTVQSGQSLGVISTTGGFYYVYYSGRYGYVLTSACNSSSTPTNSSGTATVTYSTPFYMSASTSGGYYGTLDSGDIVTTYSTSGIFTYAYIQGRYGYVLSSALSTNNTGTSFSATTNSAAPLYSSASTSASTYTTIPSGTTLSVSSSTAGFYYVAYNGYYGYIPTSYFNSSTTSGNYSFYVTTNSSAGLYSSASTSASIYTTIASGTSVGVISTSGSFYYTLYNGYYGYILISACNGGSSGVNTSVQYYLNTLYSTPLYSSANTSSVSYSTISAGTSVGVISKTFDGFYYVYVNGNYGYIPQAAMNSTGTNLTTGTNSAIATYGTVAMGSTLYSTDSTTGTALGRVSNSGTVSIISQTTTGFYYVKVGNYTGYLQIAAVTVANDATVIPITDDKSYVPTTIPLVNTSASATGVTVKKTGTIENCVSWVSLRGEANSASSRLAKVAKGSTVTVLDNEGSYTKVNYAGTTGYILSSYIA